MKKNKPIPDNFVIQIPSKYTKRGLFSKPKVEKIVEEWAKKGYRLHSMTPVYATWFPDRVTGYALNFQKVE